MTLFFFFFVQHKIAPMRSFALIAPICLLVKFIGVLGEEIMNKAR